MIAASPDRVYAALVDPDALAAWLPPAGMSGKFEHFDARPGGSYRMVLTYADASTASGKATADSDVVEARFVDIVPGVRVVQAVNFVADDPGYAGTMTMTWEFTATDDGTPWTSEPTTSPLASPRRITRPGSRPRWLTSPPTSNGRADRQIDEPGMRRLDRAADDVTVIGASVRVGGGPVRGWAGWAGHRRGRRGRVSGESAYAGASAPSSMGALTCSPAAKRTLT